MGKRRIIKARGPSKGLQTSRLVMQRELRSVSLRMFYAESGLGAPVIMIHGLGASSRWWFPIIPELTNASFRTLAVDLPGFGATPGPFPGIEGAARAIISMADHLGLAQFFLCGHSMGGAIATRIAADHRSRVRRLALIDSAGVPGRATSRWLGRLLQPWSWCPLRFYPTLIGDVLRAGPRSMAAGIRDIRDCDIRPILPSIRTPTLVIWGSNDSLTPLENGRAIVAGLKKGRLEIVPRARHIPMVSAPETVSRLIELFFREDLRSAPGVSS